MKALFALCSLALVFSFNSRAGVPAAAFGQGLIGSVWTGDGQSGSGRLTYIFRFNHGVISVESTCHVAETSSTLKAHLAATYTVDGNTAQLENGLVTRIPGGSQACVVNFPAGLKFELDRDEISIEYNGKRRPTQLKRQS